MKKILFLLFATLGVSAFGQTINYTNSKILQTAVNNDRAGVYNVLDYGADPTGVANSTTAIRNACNAAYTAGGKVIGTGTFLISDSILIRSNADFSGATFNINDDAKTAVVFLDATGESLIGKVVYFPNVNQQHSRTAGTWPGSDVGIKIVNAQGCFFYFKGIYEFNTGILITAYGAHGNVYNSYFPSKVAGCKIDLKLSPKHHDSWTNDNVFVGGEMISWSADGTGVAGTRAVLLDSAYYSVDNNVFLKTGFEGSLWEFNLDCYGTFNRFISCRWEGDAPKVRFGDYATGVTNHASGNVIDGGVDVNNITYTETIGDTYMNQVIGVNSINFQGYSSKVAFVGSSYNDNSKPSFAAMDYTQDKNTDPTTAYGFGASYDYVRFKNNTDTYPRLQVKNDSGVLSWGTGFATPDVSVQRGGVGILQITLPPTYADNTAAKAGGLTAGMIYRTSTGVLMVVY